MKLLFDQNLSFKLVQLLTDEFPDAAHVRLLGLEEADDSTLWSYARLHGYTIVSHDADFAEMSALLGAPPKIIWLRGGNRSTALTAQLLRDHASLISSWEQDPATNCIEIY